jgi:DNA-binding NtrC family response regulator
MKKLILIVEDELEMGLDLAEMLGNYDISCDVVNQYEAQAMFVPGFQSRYDMVITDLYMADVNGTSVFTEVKRLAPELPVILFSGDPRSTLVKFDAVIQKPYDILAVESILEQYGLIEGHQRLDG